MTEALQYLAVKAIAAVCYVIILLTPFALWVMTP